MNKFKAFVGLSACVLAVATTVAATKTRPSVTVFYENSAGVKGSFTAASFPCNSTGQFGCTEDLGGTIGVAQLYTANTYTINAALYEQ